MVSRPESSRTDRQARETEARLESSSGVVSYVDREITVYFVIGSIESSNVIYNFKHQ